MSACEKCWGDAFMRASVSSRSQVEEYGLLLVERKDNPCTPEQQGGGNE